MERVEKCYFYHASNDTLQVDGFDAIISYNKILLYSLFTFIYIEKTVISCFYLFFCYIFINSSRHPIQWIGSKLFFKKKLKSTKSTSYNNYSFINTFRQKSK